MAAEVENEEIDYKYLKAQSIEVGDPVKGETRPRRNARDPVLISYYNPEVRTVYDLYRKAATDYSSRPFLGTRAYLPNGKRGQYEWSSYSQCEAIWTALGNALKTLGLNRGDRLGIFSINRAEWVLVDAACHCFSVVPVALYATLGANAVEYVVNHSDISVIFSDGKNLDKVLGLEGCKQLKHIVSFDPFTDAQRDKAKENNFQLITLKELEEIGKQNPHPHEVPAPDELFTIMYTSGSTGNPKGVLLTHGNAISLVAASQRTSLPLSSSEVHMSYLPLAHSFERVLVVGITGVGGCVGFFGGHIPDLFSDIQELRPTFLAGAPRVWQRLHDKMWTTVNNEGWIKRTLFNWGVSSKMSALRAGGSSPIWDMVLFSQTKAKLGGRVRWILSGSAPLDPKLADFLKTCFCCPVIQGYGLTENFAGATLTDNQDPTVGHVGAPLACNEIKLVDVPEMNYFSTDQPNPRGEICLRGPNLFKGYYKDAEKTAEDLKADGWFHTGDVGRWNSNGTLSIIDRKKNIFKLSQGEYVAAEYLEAIFIRSPYVAQIFVHGDSLNSFLVAVVVPDFEVLKPIATQLGLPEANNEAELCKNKRIEDIILKSMNDVGKEANLHGFEFPKTIYVDHQAFAEENNLLTPTFKLRRPNLKEHYQHIITKLYEDFKKTHPDV